MKDTFFLRPWYLAFKKKPYHLSCLRAEALLFPKPLVERSVLRVRRQVPLEHEPHRVSLESEQRLDPQEHVAQLQTSNDEVTLTARAHTSITLSIMKIFEGDMHLVMGGKGGGGEGGEIEN